MINITQYLGLDKNGHLVNPRREKVFLQQGDMDGACSVYSLMMALLTCGAIKRDLATNIWSPPDGRTSEGKLIREFFNGEDGLYRDGMYLSNLAERLLSSFGKKVNVHYYDLQTSNKMAKKKKFSKFCSDIISEQVCLISVAYDSGGGHAMLVVGFEEDLNNEVSRLFCLDPGRPMPVCSFWNAVIELDAFHSGEYRNRYLPDGNKVLLQDYVAIEKK